MTSSSPPIFDAIVRIDKLPASGRSLDVDADEGERAAIAEAMGIVAVQMFRAHLSIVPFRGGLRAEGWLKARVTQESVVSFEPVDQEIAEDIDRVFLPAPRQDKVPAPNAEVFVDLDDEDFPDHIDGPEVDLSALLLETLALALDPYPRREGETLESSGLAPKEKPSGPFADLARLKGTNDDEK